MPQGATMLCYTTDATEGEEAITLCGNIDIKEEPDSSDEEEAIILHGNIDIKEEPILTESDQRPFEESDHISIHIENKLEIPEDHSVHEPIQLKKEILTEPYQGSFEESDHISIHVENDSAWRRKKRELRLERSRIRKTVNLAAHWEHEKRERVIGLILDGRHCPSEAGERCGVPKKTAMHWWREYVATGRTGRATRSGRPRVSNERDDQRLLDTIREHPFLSRRQLGEVSQFPGSTRTVRRQLKDNGLLCRRASVKPRLTESQKIDRMAFAAEYMMFDWSRVIFSDEKIFSSVSNAPVQVYRPLGDRFCSINLLERERRQFSVAVWGYISARGAGPLWQIEGILNAEGYVSILQNIMKPSVEMLYPQGDVYFLQNESLIHQSWAVHEWFRNQDRIKLIEFVPRSPDLNPIENMWAEITRSLPVGSRNSRDLWENIENKWWEINQHDTFSRTLVESVPRRLGEILRRNGSRWTGY